MTALPANINIAHARLPETYEAAKIALANCARLDECLDWANKAEALASYAKQADDDVLEQTARRIRARAIRRCGELLKQFPANGGGRPKKVSVDPDAFFDNPVSILEPLCRTEVAEKAGLSRDQRHVALKVADLPPDVFEQAVESKKAPGVHRLAEMGKRTFGPREPAPEGFKQATRALGGIRTFAEFCAQHDPEMVANGVLAHEIKAVRAQVSAIDGWLDRFVVNLKG